MVRIWAYIRCQRCAHYSKSYADLERLELHCANIEKYGTRRVKLSWFIANELFLGPKTRHNCSECHQNTLHWGRRKISDTDCLKISITWKSWFWSSEFNGTMFVPTPSIDFPIECTSSYFTKTDSIIPFRLKTVWSDDNLISIHLHAQGIYEVRRNLLNGWKSFYEDEDRAIQAINEIGIPRFLHYELDQEKLYQLIYLICLGFEGSSLSPYCLLWIINWLPGMSEIPHLDKITPITNFRKRTNAVINARF